MQHHLDETHERLSRGQDDLKLALTTIEQGHERLVTTLEAGQDMIAHLLMQMVHSREPQIMKGIMGLVDLMEERGIMQRLVTGSILRGKFYLGVQPTGYQ
jgi:hypothetical protein